MASTKVNFRYYCNIIYEHLSNSYLKFVFITMFSFTNAIKIIITIQEKLYLVELYARQPSDDF